MNRQIKESIVCGMLSTCVSFVVCCMCYLIELDIHEDINLLQLGNIVMQFFI